MGEGGLFSHRQLFCFLHPDAGCFLFASWMYSYLASTKSSGATLLLQSMIFSEPWGEQVVIIGRWPVQPSSALLLSPSACRLFPCRVVDVQLLSVNKIVRCDAIVTVDDFF